MFGKTKKILKALSISILAKFVLMFLIGHTGSLNVQSQTPDKGGSQPCTTPVFDEARKAYDQKDFKKAAERAIYSATHECPDNKDFHAFIFRYTSGADVQNGNVDLALDHLEKAFSLGYGSDGACIAVQKDEALNELHKYPRWNIAIDSCYRNFYSAIEANGDSKEIQLLKIQDQSDRYDDKIKFADLLANDAKRREKAKYLSANGRVISFGDYRSASLIFQHGTDINDIEFAQKLAQKSLELAKNQNDVCRGGRLLATVTDRLLWMKGKPQIYGTQSRPSNMTFRESLDLMKKINGFMKRGKEIPAGLISPPSPDVKPTQEPFNRTKISEAERQKLCFEPLRESTKQN